jgi:hypothetical protein
MSRAQRILLGVLAVVALLVVWLSLRTRQPPILPNDEDHRGVTDMESCGVCHGPDGVLPRSPDHPLGFDCLRCHGQP